MNSRTYLLSFAVVFAVCLASACARQEKAVVNLGVDEKVVEVKHGEIKLEETGKDVVTAQPSSQTPTQKMGDNSEVTVMYDGFGNKLERRYFKNHPRLDTVIVRTAANGRREILIYGQNGERKSVEGEIANRLMNASADEIANAAKIYETRPDGRNRVITPETVQTKPQQPSVSMPAALPSQPQPEQPQQQQQQTQQPVTVREKEARVEEQVRETWEEKDSTEGSRTRPQKAEVKAGKKEGREDE